MGKYVINAPHSIQPSDGDAGAENIRGRIFKHIMGAERRRAERVRVNLDVIYADRVRQHRGTISDISITGCFVLAAGDATTDESITITITLPNHKTIRLPGEVVYNTPEIGFAIRFIELPDSVIKFIQKLIERFRQPSAEAERTAERPN